MFVAALLPLFLFALAVDVGILQTAGQPEKIKKILSSSGIYDSVVASALDQAKNSAGDKGDGIALTNPAVKTAAEKAITPAFLQQSTETLIDSTFNWLDGKTPTPDFRIDLSSVKSTFAVEAGKAAQAQAASLPVCTSGGASSSFDPFEATCLPRGVTPSAAATQVQNDIISGQGFLKDAVITADTVKSGDTNQSVFNDQLKNAPKAYQKAKKSPIVLGILSLLAVFGVIFLSSSRRAGVRRAGITLLVVGVSLLVFAWVLNWGVNQKALPKLNLDNKVLQEKVRVLAKDLTQSLDKTYYVIGGTYAALGTLAIAGTMFIHRGKGGHMAIEYIHEPTHEPNAEPDPKPKKSSSKNIKVQ